MGGVNPIAAPPAQFSQEDIHKLWKGGKKMSGINSLPRKKKGGGIHIKPSHRGIFTAKAKAAGKGVQQYANEKAGAGGTLGKEANFAKMAKRHWRPLK